MLLLCIIIGSFLAYLLLITSFFIAWKRATPQPNNSEYVHVKISVLIAARNEVEHIGALLNDLQKQLYPKGMFEIVVVNDHSTDATPEILEKWLKLFPNLRVFHLPENLNGKKNAILFGIQHIESELIVTTDADCRMGDKWLSSIASFYADSGFKFIIAPLLYSSNSNSAFESIQALESLSLVAAGAGAAQLGHPIMCNGANLAFRRDIYLELASQVKSNVASGDDIFLLTAVKKKYSDSIGFLKSKESAVFTKSEVGFANFLAQRKRWTSKSRYYLDRDILLVAAIVGLLNISVLLLLFMGAFNATYFIYFIISLLIKSAIDFPLLYSFAIFFGKAHLLKYFWATQLLYPFYIVFMMFYGNIGTFQWKNRTYKETII